MLDFENLRFMDSAEILRLPLNDYVTYSLSSLKGSICRIISGTIVGVNEGDARSLDCSLRSNHSHWSPQIFALLQCSVGRCSFQQSTAEL